MFASLLALLAILCQQYTERGKKIATFHLFNLVLMLEMSKKDDNFSDIMVIQGSPNLIKSNIFSA